MEIYRRLKHGTIQPDESNFKQMIKELFEYNQSDNIYADFSKAPLFYQEFSGKDTTSFFNVLFKCLDAIPDQNIPVYKGANIVTLMSFATFHMNKLYCITPTEKKYETKLTYFYIF